MPCYFFYHYSRKTRSVRFAQNTLLFRTYICVIFFKGLHVVEVVYNFLLVPPFNICHEIDSPCKVSIILVCGRVITEGSTLSILSLVLNVVHGRMTLARKRRHLFDNFRLNYFY